MTRMSRLFNRPFPAAEVTAFRAADLIGRRVSFNYDRRYNAQWFTLLDAYIIARPEGVEPGFDPDKVVVTFCNEDGKGMHQGMELNPISQILVQVSAEEWAQRRHHECGPVLSHTSWDPPRRYRLRRESVLSPVAEPAVVSTPFGDQFLLPI